MHEEKMPSIIIRFIAVIIQYSIPGVIGALPLALTTALFYGADAARDMWVLGAFLIGSWFPLRSFFTIYVLKTSTANALPSQINFPILFLAGVAHTFMIPILWMMTFASLLLTIAIYLLSGQNLLITLLCMIVIQCANLYRQAKAEADNPGSMDFQFNVRDIPVDFEMLNAPGDDHGDGGLIVIDATSKPNNKQRS